MRLRISEKRGSYFAEHRTSGRHGFIDECYLSKKQIDEVKEYSYVYVNKDKSLVCWSN